MVRKLDKLALPTADGSIIELDPRQAKALLGALASYVKGADANWSSPDPQVLEGVLSRMRQGESLSDICVFPLPPPEVILQWCKSDAKWKTAYNEAVLHQAEAAFNKVNSLLTNLRNRLETGDVPSQNEIAAYRLQLDTLRWLCAKLNPAKYSEYSRLGVDQNTAWRIVYQAVCPICGKESIEVQPGQPKPGLVNNPKAQKLLSPAQAIKKEWWGKNTTHPGSRERILRIGGKKKEGANDPGSQDSKEIPKGESTEDNT